MKAKKVFEVQNFERGKNPKQAMDLGGIILETQKQKYYEDMKQAQRDVEILYNQNWEMYLRETLIGKKITAKMTSMPSMNKKTRDFTGKRETKDFTIIVEDIHTNSLGSDEFLLSIVIASSDHKMYNLYLKNKIYFE